MARHAWSVLCRSSAVDEDSKLLSLLEIVENVVIEGRVVEEEATEDTPNPLLPVPMQLVSFWVRSDMNIPETPAMRAYLVAPDGKESNPTEAKIRLDQAFTRFRHRLYIGLLPFRGPGFYEWRVETRRSEADEWEHAADVPFQVIVKTVEPRQKPDES